MNYSQEPNLEPSAPGQQQQQQYAASASSATSSAAVAATTANVTFPMRLHRLLQDATKFGFEDIICWQPGGKSFKVNHPERFAAEIMTNYFVRQTKYKSFQRQINTYGFRRIEKGPLKGGYIHPKGNFKREDPDFDLSRVKSRQPKSQITSNTASGTTSSASTSQQNQHPKITSVATKAQEEKIDGDSPASEERKMPASIPQHLKGGVGESKNGSHDQDDLSTIAWHINPFQEGDLSQDISPIIQQQQHHPAVATTSDSLLTTTTKALEIVRSESPSNYNRFPWKLYTMLEEAETEHFALIVSWIENGNAFKVHQPEEFVTKVMPNYFDQTKFESFRRRKLFSLQTQITFVHKM